MSRVLRLKTLLSFVFSSFVLLGIAAAAPKPTLKQLEKCVASALIGDDIETRIQTPEDATFEDARVGAIM